MFCKKAPEKPCCLAALSPHLDMMVVVMVILVCLLYLATLVDVGDHVVGDHVAGDHVAGDHDHDIIIDIGNKDGSTTTMKIIDIYNVDSTSLWVEIHQCE